MPNPILKQAVVIGAGMGGLAAAKAVAPHFEKVIVFERDALPDAPAPRLGTPQARHTHGLLAGGCRALEHLFPGRCHIKQVEPLPVAWSEGLTYWNHSAWLPLGGE